MEDVMSIFLVEEKCFKRKG